MRSRLIGVVLGVAWGCSADTPPACAGNADCILSGMAGVCTVEGHCAYPSDGCPSGYAYPDGAADGFAGECAEVDIDPVSDTGAPMDATGTDDGSDDDAGSTTQPNLDDSGGTSQTTNSAESTGSATDSGGCTDLITVVVPAIADTFFSTGCEGMSNCEASNFGASPGQILLRIDAWSTMMAIRFGEEALNSGLQVVVEASLVLAVANEGTADLEVATLDPSYNWAEGNKNGALAADGESSHEHAVCPDQPWPANGPRSATVTLLGAINSGAVVGSILTIPLDVDAGLEGLSSGADSVLVYASDNSPTGGAYVSSNEGGLGPVLHLRGC